MVYGPLRIIVRVKGTDPDHQGRNQMWLRLECGHTTVRRDRWVIEGKSRARCSDCQYEGV